MDAWNSESTHLLVGIGIGGEKGENSEPERV